MPCRTPTYHCTYINPLTTATKRSALALWVCPVEPYPPLFSFLLGSPKHSNKKVPRGGGGGAFSGLLSHRENCPRIGRLRAAPSTNTQLIHIGSTFSTSTGGRSEFSISISISINILHIPCLIRFLGAPGSPFGEKKTALARSRVARL